VIVYKHTAPRRRRNCWRTSAGRPIGANRINGRRRRDRVTQAAHVQNLKGRAVITMYNRGLARWNTGNYRALLVGSGYTPDKDHTLAAITLRRLRPRGTRAGPRRSPNGERHPRRGVVHVFRIWCSARSRRRTPTHVCDRVQRHRVGPVALPARGFDDAHRSAHGRDHGEQVGPCEATPVTVDVAPTYGTQVLYTLGYLSDFTFIADPGSTSSDPHVGRRTPSPWLHPSQSCTRTRHHRPVPRTDPGVNPEIVPATACITTRVERTSRGTSPCTSFRRRTSRTWPVGLVAAPRVGQALVMPLTDAAGMTTAA